MANSLSWHVSTAVALLGPSSEPNDHATKCYERQDHIRLLDKTTAIAVQQCERYIALYFDSQSDSQAGGEQPYTADYTAVKSLLSRTRRTPTYPGGRVPLQLWISKLRFESLRPSQQDRHELGSDNRASEPFSSLWHPFWHHLSKIAASSLLRPIDNYSFM